MEKVKLLPVCINDLSVWMNLYLHEVPDVWGLRGGLTDGRTPSPDYHQLGGRAVQLLIEGVGAHTSIALQRENTRIRHIDDRLVQSRGNLIEI